MRQNNTRNMMMGMMKSAMEGQKTMADPTQMMDNEAVISFMGGFTIKRLMSMMGAMGAKPLTREQMLAFNAMLNQIKK